jgi:hypothetical protein
VKPDGWFALSHPNEDKPGLWAMRADAEVLPMVLTAVTQQHTEHTEQAHQCAQCTMHSRTRTHTAQTPDEIE